ncbi:MAG TPA: hypothetical protein DDW52_12175 [Planctomycetaceae bacterium]|nr:hypothetical protein [Planctomycetaceae bacterium]
MLAGIILSTNSARKRTVFQLIAMTLLSSVVGCGGCQRKEEEKESRQLKDKKALDVFELQALPIDHEQTLLTAKPGHWYETRQEFKSNDEDLQVVVEGTVHRGKSEAKVPGTEFLNAYTRRTSLPKGQLRSIDLQLYVPPAAVAQQADGFEAESTALRLQTELYSYPLMTPLLPAADLKPARELKPHEFQFVVLCPQAESYAHLGALDLVQWIGEDALASEQTRSYYVTLAKPREGEYPLPKSLLTMTATAVILWDAVDPETLSTDQRLALIDWLHWGGQLVVSGPTSWSLLQDSFLSPYLPATASKANYLKTEDFAEISDNFKVEIVNRRDGPRLNLGEKPMTGAEFTLAPDASWVPMTGELVAESTVGRGRVVMSAFPLRDPRIYNWRYYSGLVSSAFLRRPPRMAMKERREQWTRQTWAAPYTGGEADARLNSNVRILARDLAVTAMRGQGEGNSLAQSPETASSRPEVPSENPSAAGSIPEARDSDAAPVGQIALNLPDTTQPGAESAAWSQAGASWNDYSGISYQASSALTSAARISLPERATILKLIGVYLLFLVPVNWLIFKLAGRLEYAWIAAPILGLIGMVAVTRIARLDIGFARRATEIGVLELHGGHERGHLSRYVALYTSLSTNYSINLPEDGSVMLPLSEPGARSRRTGGNMSRMKTNYGRSEGVNISPMTVLSNSTKRIHAEQMVTLEGPLSLGARGSGELAVKNDSGVPISSALVVRRTSAGDLESAWIDTLRSGEAATLAFAATTPDALFEKWNQDVLTQRIQPSAAELQANDDLWLGGVLGNIVTKLPIGQGQIVLVGLTDGDVGMLTLEPGQDQMARRNVMVAHLKAADLPAIRPDLSSIDKRSEQ